MPAKTGLSSVYVSTVQWNMQSGALAAFPILGIGCFCFFVFCVFCVILVNSGIFNGIVWDLRVVFWECEGLLWCLLLVGPKQQDGIAMTSELVFLFFLIHSGRFSSMGFAAILCLDGLVGFRTTSVCR